MKIKISHLQRVRARTRTRSHPGPGCCANMRSWERQTHTDMGARTLALTCARSHTRAHVLINLISETRCRMAPNYRICERTNPSHTPLDVMRILVFILCKLLRGYTSQRSAATLKPHRHPQLGIIIRPPPPSATSNSINMCDGISVCLEAMHHHTTEN